MRQRLYTDTSVIGGCEDEEFSDWSIALMREFISAKRILLLSALTSRELSNAPRRVRARIGQVPEKYIELLKSGAEATELAAAYIAAGVITQKSSDDALHIAIATLAEADVLVSRNLKHIVGLTRIQGYNSVNAAHGYQTR